MSNSVWEGGRVRLRAVEPTDWQHHFEWDRDSEMARALDHVWFPASQAAARRWAEEQSLRKPENDVYFFEIETLDGQHVGSISTHNCNPHNGTFSYGLAIKPAHQRKGYAAEAISLLLRHFFHELRYQKVTVNVYSFNEPSIRLHERLGFQREGRLRRMIYTRGAYHDELFYGLTAEAFAATLHSTEPQPGVEAP